MNHRWSSLTHLQIGRYAEYFFKLHFTLLGLDVYKSEVDDRGIDFVVRKEPDSYWDVQVKSLRLPNSNYVFFRKDKFRIRDNMLVALALLEDGRSPSLYLIPATAWANPESPFSHNDYIGKKSAPEYGLRLHKAGIAAISDFRIETSAVSIFGLAPIDLTSP